MKPLTLEILAERLDNERAAREAKERAVEKERAVQFNEYARRLDDLNHSQDRAAEAAAQTVRREVFDDYVRDNEARVRLALNAETIKREAVSDTVNIRLDTLTAALTRIDGALSLVRFLGVGGLVGVAFGLYSVFGPK